MSVILLLFLFGFFANMIRLFIACKSCVIKVYVRFIIIAMF